MESLATQRKIDVASRSAPRSSLVEHRRSVVTFCEVAEAARPESSRFIWTRGTREGISLCLGLLGSLTVGYVATLCAGLAPLPNVYSSPPVCFR